MCYQVGTIPQKGASLVYGFFNIPGKRLVAFILYIRSLVIFKRTARAK
jgi:hypothetical protein